MISVLFVIYEVPPGADTGLGFQHQEESRISFSLFGVRLLLRYRLQPSLGLILIQVSPGWILFEGTVIRNQREIERGGENIL